MYGNQIIGWRKNGAPIWSVRGGAPKKSETLTTEMEAVRAEIKVIEEIPEADVTDEDITRAEQLLEEWDIKKADRDKAVAREEQVAEVMRAALDPSRTEQTDEDKNDNDSGKWSRDRQGRKSPELMRKVDPYEGSQELVRTLWDGGQFDIPGTIDRAQAAVERAPSYVNDPARERLMELVNLDNRHAPMIARHMLLTGSPEYHDQFRDYIKSKGTYAGEALRAAMSLTDSAGGYLVPFTLDPTIILTNAGIVDSIRNISTVKTIATDTWNGVTSAGVNAEWLAEGVSAADASPTFGQPTITPKKAAAWVFGSYEVLADSGFASELGRLLADAKARLEGAAFATGNTGATKPRGIIAAVAAVTASIVTSATTNAFVVGDIYRVTDALRARDASQASWIGNKRFFSLARQFDTSGGSAFWANLGMSVPQQLLGQPIYENSTMAAAVTTGANCLLAGNFSEYYIVDRVGMSVMYEPMVKSATTGRPTGEAGWFSFWRVGADVVDADAFRLLQLNQAAAATALA